MPQKLGPKAIPVARQYLEFRGYTVEDASTSSTHTGYNLIARRGSEVLTVVAKGCSRLWGIHDLLPAEVSAERHLVADFLYVVYFDGRKEPKLCILPREALKPEFVIPKLRYRINAKFKKESTLKPLLHAL